MGKTRLNRTRNEMPGKKLANFVRKTKGARAERKGRSALHCRVGILRSWSPMINLLGGGGEDRALSGQKLKWTEN